MFPSSPAPAVPSAEHARKLVWITPQCGVIRACYLELGGRQHSSHPPRHREIFCFDKLTTSKDLKISPLFGEAWVTDQLPDTTSSPPRPASSPLCIDIDMHHTDGHGYPGPYTLSAVETRQVENWSKYWVLHKIWRANIFSGREYQLQDLHPLHPAVRDWIYTNANFIYYVFFISVLLYTYFL